MIRFEKTTVRYFNDDQLLAPTFSDLSLHIPTGQLVLLTGVSGCGKTTLLRCLNGLVPCFYEAEMTGEIFVDGQQVSTQETRQLASTVGMVFQDPRSEFFTLDVRSELAFSCENFEIPSAEIRDRIKTVSTLVGITELLDRNLATLSSGEKQKVAVACAMMLMPKVLLFDEPSANLDADGLAMLGEVMQALKTHGTTIVVADHRLAYLDGLLDRCLVLHQRAITADLSAAELVTKPASWFTLRGLRQPHTPTGHPIQNRPTGSSSGPRLTNTTFAYRGCSQLWQVEDLVLPASGVVCITGPNGSGKTTFLKVLLGLLKCRTGSITLSGRRWRPRVRRRASAYVMQDVEYQLMGESVWDEMLIGVTRSQANKTRAQDLLERIGLADFAERHPLTLSGGQKQRLAIALACMKQADVICLDEPTSGLDSRNMALVSELLSELADAGVLVLVISHDQEFLDQTAEITIEIDNQQVQYLEPVEVPNQETRRNHER